VAIRSQKKIVLLALIAVVAVLAGLLARGYLKYREFRENPAKIIEAIPEGTNIVLGEVRHTAVREGRKEWVLEAASAQYSESTKEAVFDEVKVTFFLENGDQIHLQGQKGTINTASNDMQVAGNVRVEKDDQVFLTEKIDYNHTNRYLISPSEVRITGPRFDLRADTMRVDLAAETAFFKGAVKGTIDAANQLRL
jgi:lipopolysaccharide export system protein LptC